MDSIFLSASLLIKVRLRRVKSAASSLPKLLTIIYGEQENDKYTLIIIVDYN